MMSFAKCRGRSFPDVDLERWKEVSERLRMPLPVAQMYYAVFSVLKRTSCSVSMALEVYLAE